MHSGKFLLLSAIAFFAPILLHGQQPKGGMQLPTPTGEFAVGRKTFIWTDATDSNRTVKVAVWYPSEPSGRDVALYFPDFEALSRNKVTEEAIENRYGPAHARLREGALRSNSYDDAPVARNNRPFPLLLFSPGLGGSPYDYSIQLEDLSSHGYVVAAVEHVNDTLGVVLSEGKIVPFDRELWGKYASTSSTQAVEFYEGRAILWAKDLLFCLQQFAALSADKNSPFYKAIDLRRVGAFGHSHGGRSAATACILDPKIAACLNEDGRLDEAQRRRPYWPLPGRKFNGAFAMLDWFDPGLDESDFAGMHTTMNDYALARLKDTGAALEAYREARGGSVHFTMLRQSMSHTAFTDFPLLTSTSDSSRTLALENLRTICKLVQNFFDLAFGKSAGQNKCHSSEGKTIIQCYEPKERR